jgi:hypothetical protein
MPVTAAEVAKHNTKDDFWHIIGDILYDISSSWETVLVVQRPSCSMLLLCTVASRFGRVLQDVESGIGTMGRGTKRRLENRVCEEGGGGTGLFTTGEDYGQA